MKHLFQLEGEQALLAVMRRSPLLAFDFDGTLAPIVARPDDAKVSVAVTQRLAKLSTIRPVAIVTGRSVADVAARLDFEPQFLIGNHGAEDPSSGPVIDIVPALDTFRLHLASHLDDLNAVGVQVEDKHYSLALHYRLAPSSEAAMAQIALVLDGLDPELVAFGGKCVVNVVPKSSPDKADAVISLVRRSGSGAAIFVGDDVNDESVFERASPQWLTVRIGRDDPFSRARFFLESPDEVATMLQRMLVSLGAA